jgi:hypothetical protein
MPTIETFAQFRDYFANLKNITNLGIKDFVFGDSAQILNRLNSLVEYPVLWLHTPDIKPYESGGRKNRFTSDFLLLQNAAADDYEQQQSNFNDCLDIVWKVLRQMERDADDSRFDFDINSVEIVPRHSMTSDNLNGWFVTFSIATPGCDSDCCD